MGINLRQAFKTVFSSPLLLVNQVKKISKDSFVAGLIFGALFSLLVNLITIQFQEMLDKQKNLEAVEREIYSHLDLANKMKAEALQTQDEAEFTDPYVFTDRFSTSVWDTGAISGFIYDLKPDIQDSLYNYYATFIDNQNRHMEHAETSVNQMEYEDQYCMYSTQQSADWCGDTWKVLQDAVYHFEEVRIMIADVVIEESTDLLKDFHPTQDRLDSFWLRLFLGDEKSDIIR